MVYWGLYAGPLFLEATAIQAEMPRDRLGLRFGGLCARIQAKLTQAPLKQRRSATFSTLRSNRRRLIAKRTTLLLAPTGAKPLRKLT